MAVAVALPVGAFAVDRLVLFVWQLQVFSFHREIVSAIKKGIAVPTPGKYGFLATGLEQFLVMPKDDRWPARYLTVRTDRLLLKVESVTVDGGGNLHLRFFPPTLAWTTRWFPRADYTHHGDPVEIDSRYHYQFTLDIFVSRSAGPEVELHQGEFHFTPPLTDTELKPRWFP